tara:strand:- start:644 stop:1324 length:681 start_codon:yes stop_codon:yes gene_type:complete
VIALGEIEIDISEGNKIEATASSEEKSSPKSDLVDTYFSPKEVKNKAPEFVRYLREHPLADRIKEVNINKKTLFSGLVAVLIITSIILVLMIPSPAGPLEGDWVKGDGQLFDFNGDGTMTNEIYQDSSWTTNGDLLTIVSTVQYLDENGYFTSRIIVQEVTYTLSEDENAMWWEWKSVSIDGIEQDVDVNTCSLLLKEKVAENNYEYSIKSKAYTEETPSGCIQNA